MNTKSKLAQSGQARRTLSPAPRPRRFLIQRLEERIAPRRDCGPGTGHTRRCTLCTL